MKWGGRADRRWPDGVCKNFVSTGAVRVHILLNKDKGDD